MPEFKPKDVMAQLQKIEDIEGLKITPETFKTEEKIEQQVTLSPEALDNGKQVSLMKRLDNLNNIEKIRKELGLSDLKKEETDIIVRQKMKIQETLTGMKQQTAEIVNPQKDLENLSVGEKPANPDEVVNEILLDPNKKIERKEVVPFDIKKVYIALENVLTVFDARARRVGGFDIMPQQSFDSLVDLYNFMQEKIIGKNPNEVGEKVNLDLTNPDEINKEMVKKFETAMNSLEITETAGWQTAGSQGEYLKDMNDIRDVIGGLSQELAPFAGELKKSDQYNASAGSLETAVGKTYNLAGLFNQKAETFQGYMGR